MKNILLKILNDLKQNIIEKNHYNKYFLDIDKEIQNYEVKNNVKTSDYVESHQFFDSDKELLYMNEKLKLINEKPEISLPELIDFYKNQYDLFLEKYNIGFLSKFLINQNSFVVKIDALITNSNKKNTLKFNKSIKFLESKGFILTKKNYNVFHLVDNITNINKIKEIIKNIGGKNLKITSYKDNLDCYEFIVPFQDINKINNFVEIDGKNETKLITNNKKLNQDEIKEAINIINQLYNLIDSTEIEPIVYCYLLNSYFCEFCNILNIETKRTEDFNNLFKHTRNNMRKIKNIRNEISNCFSLDKISETIDIIRLNFEKYTLLNLSFTSNITFDKYNYISFELFYYTSDHFFGIDDELDLISEENLKNQFETNGINKSSENLYISDSSLNKKKIESILLSKYPNIEITGMESEKNMFDCWYIKKIKGRFKTMADLII